MHLELKPLEAIRRRPVELCALSVKPRLLDLAVIQAKLAHELRVLLEVLLELAGKVAHDARGLQLTLSDLFLRPCVELVGLLLEARVSEKALIVDVSRVSSRFVLCRCILCVRLLIKARLRQLARVD